VSVGVRLTELRFAENGGHPPGTAYAAEAEEIPHDMIHRSVPNLNVRDASAAHDYYVDCR